MIQTTSNIDEVTDKKNKKISRKKSPHNEGILMMPMMMIIFCMIIIYMVFTMILFFLIFLFPSIDDNLLFLSPQIDRFSMNEGRIEFFNIISSNIFFSTSREMSLYDVGKCIYEYIERFTILFFHMMLMFSLSNFLEVFDDRSRVFCAEESELFTSWKLYYNIRHTKQSRPPRPRTNLNSLNFIIRNIENIS